MLKSFDSSKNKSTSTYVDPKVLEMQARYQEQRRKESIENVQMVTAMTATGALMLTISGKELNRKEEDYEIGTYFKAIFGLGWKFIPIISNMNYSTPNRFESQEVTESFPFVEGSFEFAAFNSGFISWKIAPYGYFGMNAFSQGATGTHFCYGGSSFLGIKKKFKILLQGEYLYCNGNMTIDNVVNFSDSKDTIGYSYSTLKYGPGFQLRIGDSDSWGGSTEYLLSAFKEQISFLKGQARNVYSFQFKISAKFCSFLAEYSPGYPAAGEVLFPNNYTKSKERLMNIAIAVPLTLFYNQIWFDNYCMTGYAYNSEAFCYAGRRSNNHLHIAIIYTPADVILFSFLLLSSSVIFQIGSGTGLDVIKYPTCSNTCSLPASLADTSKLFHHTKINLT
jgi:hypothetical protein